MVSWGTWRAEQPQWHSTACGLAGAHVPLAVERNDISAASRRHLGELSARSRRDAHVPLALENVRDERASAREGGGKEGEDRLVVEVLELRQRVEADRPVRPRQ